MSQFWSVLEYNNMHTMMFDQLHGGQFRHYLLTSFVLNICMIIICSHCTTCDSNTTTTTTNL